ncbi:MAG TPA: STAS domain-containing protein [Roseiflexaceae bacterium]|nr:STAS domain-containing protein [Roseiflexaceae bacterium]
MNDRLIALLNQHKAQIADNLLASAAAQAIQAGSDGERRAMLLAGLDALIGMLQQPKQVLEQTLQELVVSQMRAGLGREEALALLDAQREAIYRAIEQADLPGPESLAAGKALEELMHQSNRLTIDTYHRDLVDRLQEASATQAQLREAIQELSTPIIPVYNGVLVVPLVGRVDSLRAQTLTETMLEAIAREQAEIVLLDITGVAVVDTRVANHLMQTARAAGLLGSQVVLVGISAEVAQTLVQLGLDLGQLVTLSNLQNGLEYALARHGLAITATP